MNLSQNRCNVNQSRTQALFYKLALEKLIYYYSSIEWDAKNVDTEERPFQNIEVFLTFSTVANYGWLIVEYYLHLSAIFEISFKKPPAFFSTDFLNCVWYFVYFFLPYAKHLLPMA
jgi:hypothetical protein